MGMKSFLSTAGIHGAQPVGPGPDQDKYEKSRTKKQFDDLGPGQTMTGPDQDRAKQIQNKIVNLGPIRNDPRTN